ncbi:ABC transporter permease subunit [Nocardioides ungokensis]|uniref:ABC transporter permease subunit n=1 Tax=Nocardioides ungokensis TaxID=1643322 RepID=UPI001FE56BB6|nr:hypothetical protein [Nocardioides ungokensis]
MSTEPKTQAAPEPEDVQAPGTAEQKPTRRPIAAADWIPTVKTTIAAFVLALLIGAVLIAFSSQAVLETLPYFFSYPWDFFSEAAHAVGESYWALLTGSVGSTSAMGTTLVRSAPLICAGLGVTLAFRAGLFNIGAQGQLILGALAGGTSASPGTCPRASTCWPRSWPACSVARSGAASLACSRPARVPTRSSPRS